MTVLILAFIVMLNGVKHLTENQRDVSPPAHARKLAPANLNHHRMLWADVGIVSLNLCALDAHAATIDQSARLASAAGKAGRNHEIDDIHRRFDQEVGDVGGQL